MSADKTITLMIDGTEVSVPAGTLLIRAAEQIGTYIPRFCDHPLLDPLGACRQCMVEIEGQRKPLTACTTPVADGMVVRTQSTSALARDAQEGVLELLLINHPLDCPMCDKGGECPLQDQALSYGPGGSRYVDPKRRFAKPVPISPLVKLDRERCVLCARCTRFAEQIAGEPFIELFERGALEQVAIFEDEPYESVFSGNVIQICPVGALTSSTFRFRARPFDMTSAPGVCNRCASGCAIDVQERRGELARVLARPDAEVNDEWICDKGRFAYAYARSPERVTEPLVRKGDDFVAVSWTEALDVVVSRIGEARAAGRGAAVLGGAQLLDEDSYALSRFARAVLGTNDVDFRLRGGTEEEDVVLAAVARTATATNADVDAAAAIVVAGIDLREESPIVFLRLRKAARRGARILEVGPRRTLEGAGARWSPCAPGEEGAALASIAADARASGSSLVVLAGDRLASSPGALTTAWNIAAVPGGRFGWIPRKGGARGALDAGLHPALLPGGRRVDDAAARAEVGDAWGVPIPEVPGRDARAILSEASTLGVLLLAGADPARDFADESLGARGLDDAPFVVALDLFLTESSSRADVVLPAAAVYERAGTITNWEGRAHATAAAVPPAGLAEADHEILAQIAAGLGNAFPSTLGSLRAEMRSLARVPEPARPLPDRPAAKTTARDGLALAVAPALLDEGTMMTGADALCQTAPSPFIELNREDAQRLGIRDGDEVELSPASDGERALPARVTDRVARGAVFAPAFTGRALHRAGERVAIQKATPR